MRRNSKTLSKPTSNVIDRTFEMRRWRKVDEAERASQREQVERQAQLIIDANLREARLISFFQKLPVEKQRDMLAIAEVYHEHYGTGGLAES